ncbi:ADP-ribosylglycohydrolase family protein [Glaciibacter sp. 2TAF33]|uniref:ADP-ribosylglycohydrolase family protein n=1 Tax=Glaciibacter sp. 2TAF33 TaxID=3233015 RepID=UPI003F92379C
MSGVDIRGTDYAAQVYAGVLGKLIGVYLGRPVEGWPYETIRDQLGQLDTYVNDKLGIPLIVADDDISGTLTFARVVEDAEPGQDIQPSNVGDTWLNYIIEDKTILWWGGFGRSTEHTAFLNLKAGIHAPASGSIARNGQTLAEQIGAQIFSDAFAMMHPGDAKRAVALTRAAASVSHDGVALDCAGFLAAMRANAFEERNLDRLIDGARTFVTDPRLTRLVDDVCENSNSTRDWREVRDWVDAEYGYSQYTGPCHALSNTAMTLAALRVGGDDFRRAIMVAASVGFDTDSNAGTVGCLNGIRLGIQAIADLPDLREPVADRALVVSADGGECVTDAAREAYRIVDSARHLAGDTEPSRRPRFDFTLPGSVHGFSVCPYLGQDPGAWARNLNVEDGIDAVTLHLPAGTNAGVGFSTPTFLDPLDEMTNFSTVASPSLYPTNVVTARLSATSVAEIRFFALYAEGDGTHIERSGSITVQQTENEVDWEVPAHKNHVPFRIGLELITSPNTEVDLRVHSLDWAGAPRDFKQQGVLLSSIWDTKPSGLAPWVSSAKNFEADFATTFAVSHPDKLGLVTTGTRDWADYEVRSHLLFSLHEVGGLVLRARGHRQFLAGIFTGGDTIQIVRQDHERREVLAEAAFAYELDRTYSVVASCAGSRLTVTVDGVSILEATTEYTKGGGAGFIVERGTLTADGFSARAIHTLDPNTKTNERKATQ